MGERVTSNLTHTDRLVLTMATLADEGMEEFDEWTLTVKAWEMFPEYYGLRGFERLYPDHKSVCNIYQKPKGPVGLGYMEKVRENEYRILGACLLRARELDGSKNHDVANSKISKKVFERLDRANKSRAVQQFYRDKKTPQDWNAAATFFEVSTPGDSTGLGGSKKHGNADRNANNGNVNDEDNPE